MHNNNAARHSIVSIAVTVSAAALLLTVNVRADFESTGFESTGMEPTGMESTGFESTGIESTGIESTMGLAAAGTADLSREKTLADAMQDYRLAFGSGLYDEAADSMDRYIRTLLQDENFDRRTWAHALVSLGNAQRETSHYAAAIENYELAIDTLTAATNRLDASLIDPYLAAGTALADSGQFDEAARMLEFAVHLQQVNGGLFNMEQTVPLTQLSAFYLKTGNYSRAVAANTSNLNVVDQNYPGDDIRKTPAMLAQARVLAAAGQLIDSHSVYRRTIEMIERVDGTQSPDLLPVFYEMVDFITNNHIKDGFDGPIRARRFLQRAIHVAENSAEATPIQRADAYIQMGDFLASNTMNRPGAVRYYQKAWQTMSHENDLEDQIQKRFGNPLLLNQLPRGTGSTMHELLAEVDEYGGDPNSQITVSFDVDAEGFPRNVEIVEGAPDVYLSKLVVEHVSRFIFRPRLEHGEALVTNDVRWSFFSRSLGGDLSD